MTAEALEKFIEYLMDYEADELYAKEPTGWQEDRKAIFKTIAILNNEVKKIKEEIPFP